jgi:hypothetical protein
MGCQMLCGGEGGFFGQSKKAVRKPAVHRRKTHEKAFVIPPNIVPGEFGVSDVSRTGRPAKISLQYFIHC